MRVKPHAYALSSKSINQNKYNRKIEPVHIATEVGILKGRDQDRKKISMPEVPLSKEEEQEFQKGNL